jgi:hypothetical protein
MINNIFQTPKKSDPRPWCPHYMRLHRWWQILNLCHGDCASERGKISLYSSQNPLSLTGWKLSCCCWSPCGGGCGPWPRTSPVPRIIHGRTGPTSAHNRHISVKCSGIKKMIYIKNNIKITYV